MLAVVAVVDVVVVVIPEGDKGVVAISIAAFTIAACMTVGAVSAVGVGVANDGTDGESFIICVNICSLCSFGPVSLVGVKVGSL